VSRYAIVCDGQVVNVCLWDGVTDWTPDEGCTVHKLPDDSPVGPGWTRSGNNRWVAPAPAEVAPEPVAVTVDPTALADLLTAVQDPNVDVRQALADFAAALNPDPA
jgi:hypothetical protein